METKEQIEIVYEIKKRKNMIAKFNRLRYPSYQENILTKGGMKSGMTMINGHISPRKFIPDRKKEKLSVHNFVARYNEDQTKKNLMSLLTNQVANNYKKASSKYELRKDLFDFYLQQPKAQTNPGSPQPPEDQPSRNNAILPLLPKQKGNVSHRVSDTKTMNIIKP